MAIKAIFFDLDGTLLNTAKDLIFALNSILQEDEKAPLPYEEVSSSVSNGANAMIKLGYHLDSDSNELAPLRQRFLAHYERKDHTETVAYSGIESLIENISKAGLQWGVITNKPTRYAIKLMSKFHFASLPCCILSPDHVQQPKPHAEPMYLACDIANCKPEEVIYIGDHKRDIDCGLNAGTITVSAAYGYIDENDCVDSWGGHHIANNSNDLWPIIRHYLP